MIQVQAPQTSSPLPIAPAPKLSEYYPRVFAFKPLMSFQGEDCSVVCPNSFGVACSGRGQCNTNGTCSCNFGFRGDACQLECQGGALNPCMGRGTCLADASCNCSSGFYGAACGVACSVGLAGLMCSGRGSCDANGACACVSGLPGLISGYSGDACQHVVYNRTGTRAFSTDPRDVASETLAAGDKWLVAIAPLAIASAYILICIKRAVTALA
jgi:hypothetical protein